MKSNHTSIYTRFHAESMDDEFVATVYTSANVNTVNASVLPINSMAVPMLFASNAIIHPLVTESVPHKSRNLRETRCGIF